MMDSTLKRHLTSVCPKEVRIKLSRIDEGLFNGLPEPRDQKSKQKYVKAKKLKIKEEFKVKVENVDESEVKLESVLEILPDASPPKIKLEHLEDTKPGFNFPYLVKNEVKIKVEGGDEVYTFDSIEPASSLNNDIDVGEEFLLKVDVNVNEGAHRCPNCHKTLYSQNAVQKHLQSAHCVRLWKCAKCPKTFGNKSNLERHSIVHEDETRRTTIGCEICGIGFLSERGYVDHSRMRHGLLRSRTNKCYFCGFLTVSPNLLEEHVRAHNLETPSTGDPRLLSLGKEYKTMLKEEELDGKFSAEQVVEMERFRRAIRNDLKTKVTKTGNWYICVNCGCKKKCAKSMKAHLAEHRNDNPFRCSTCEYVSLNLPRLMEHIKIQCGKKMRCPECCLMFLTQTSLEGHIRHVHREKGSSCPICRKKFPTRVELNGHIQIHNAEEDGQTHHCDLCKTKFFTRNDLQQHRKMHQQPTRKLRYKCYFCDYRAYEKTRILSHVFLHTNEKPYKCRVCGFSCSLKDSLKKHELVHERNLLYLTCPYQGCSAKYRYKVSLAAHIKRHNKAALPKFSCDFAGCTFSTIYGYGLKMHIRSVHKKEFNFHCQVCGKKFAMKHKMEAHVKVHHTNEKEFKCDHAGCGKAFVNGSRLKHHQAHVHVEGKNYTCSVCEKDFKTKSGLKVHCQRSHPDNPEKPFKKIKCYFCQREWFTLSALNKHMRTHTRELTYSCLQPGCKKLMFKSEDLKQHRLEFHADVPFPHYECQLCSKQFKQKHYLSDHIAREHHKTAETFKCQNCEYTTKYKSSLTIHFRSVHTKIFFSCTKCPKKYNRACLLRSHERKKHSL